MSSRIVVRPSRQETPERGPKNCHGRPPRRGAPSKSWIADVRHEHLLPVGRQRAALMVGRTGQWVPARSVWPRSVKRRSTDVVPAAMASAPAATRGSVLARSRSGTSRVDRWTCSRLVVGRPDVRDCGDRRDGPAVVVTEATACWWILAPRAAAAARECVSPQLSGRSPRRRHHPPAPPGDTWLAPAYCCDAEHGELDGCSAGAPPSWGQSGVSRPGLPNLHDVL